MVEKIEDKIMKNEEYEKFEKFVYKICEEFNIDKNKIEIIRREKPHKIDLLNSNQMAIYTFSYKGEYFKIGKAWSNSNPRFKYQHYNPNSTNSNLAKRILDNDEFCNKEKINENNIQDWMKNNLQRIDIIIDKDLKIFTLNLFESCLHYKYEPIYEGYKSQK